MWEHKDIGFYYGSAIGVAIGAVILFLFGGLEFWYIIVIGICLSLLYFIIGSNNIKKREMKKRRIEKNKEEGKEKDIEDMGVAFGRYLGRIFSNKKEIK
jgi:phosphotransferase system  glucose/maltose/N-acetylglucosamine-specific IIC component